MGKLFIRNVTFQTRYKFSKIFLFLNAKADTIYHHIIYVLKSIYRSAKIYRNSEKLLYLLWKIFPLMTTKVCMLCNCRWCGDVCVHFYNKFSFFPPIAIIRLCFSPPSLLILSCMKKTFNIDSEMIFIVVPAAMSFSFNYL